MTTQLPQGPANSMKEICREEVPQYLRNSNLYLSLSHDDESEFSVPPQFCNELKPIRLRQDVEWLLETLSYWMFNELPRELVDYAMNEESIKFDDIFAKYERTLPELHILREVINGDGSNIFMIVARHGSVPLMKMFKEKGERGLDHACVSRQAIECGHIGCLQFAHEHGSPLPEDACALAGNNGHAACLQYAHEHGCEMGPLLCIGISLTGRLDCLKYAHKHGCGLSANIMHTVTMLHFWDCMKYCHESGLELDAATCTEATRDNRLDILTYAHQRGCELGGTAYVAMSVGRLDCFKYAYEQDLRLREVFAEVAAGAGHCACSTYCSYTLHTMYL